MDTRGVVRLGMPGDEKPKAKDYHHILTNYCTDWISIGLQLDLEQSALDVISADHRNDNRECFRLTLEKWLDMDVKATWSTLELAITNAKRQKLSLKPLNTMPPETAATVQGASATSSSTAASNTQGQSDIMNTKPVMFELTKIVIPRILNVWDIVAEAFRYEIPTIEAIKEKERGDPKKCCREFFKDWLQTKHGAEAGPKVWSTIIKVLKEIDDIDDAIVEDITEEIKKLK